MCEVTPLSSILELQVSIDNGSLAKVTSMLVWFLKKLLFYTFILDLEFPLIEMRV